MRIAETLADAGHSVTIICKQADGLPIDAIARGVRYVRVPMRWRTVLPRVGLLKFSTFESFVRDKVLEIRPTVIHANDLIALPAATRLARRIGAKVVVDIHDLYLHGPKKRSRLSRLHGRKTEEWHIKLADAVLTVSEGIADHLRDTHGIARPVVVMNAPDPDAVSADAAEIATVREVIGLSPQVPLGVYTGARHLVRGTDRLVAALAEVPGLQFAMVGQAPAQVDGHLLDLARSAGCADRLHLLPPVPHEDVTRFIASADFGIVPQNAQCLNHEYSMPHKLFEMVFAGLPIAVSNLREMSAFVRRTECGIVMERGDVDDIAATMRRLINERGSLKLSPHRLSKLIRDYGWPSQARKLLDVYEQLGASAARRPDSVEQPMMPARRVSAR